MENKTFMDGLERYKIEHPLPQVSPAIQMSYALLSTIFITHQLNSVSENQSKKYTMKPPEMSSEFNRFNFRDYFEQNVKHKRLVRIRRDTFARQIHIFETAKN